jgi:nucleoside-diphosphate-sugar epimerase
VKIAITGGTGFVGRHLAESLVASGNDIVLISRGMDNRDQNIRKLDRSEFRSIGTNNVEALANAFAGCYAVAHFAGINREIGEQTYEAVHIDGTRNVVAAAKKAGVKKILFLSFLRARPDCGSTYHESKWTSEEIVRSSGLDYTILKAGVIYGKGDHMLDHLSHSLHTFPLMALVGMKSKPVRPVAVEDLIIISVASLLENRLSNQTVAVTGPEEMNLGEAVRRVANVIGKPVLIFPMPVAFHYLMAYALEATMVVPLVAKAQVKILSEGVVDPLPACSQLPPDLLPATYFTEQQISKGLPPPASFGLKDLKFCARTPKPAASV